VNEIHGPERNKRVEPNSDNTPNEDAGEETGDTSFDFWSDEGARRFNDILDEGNAYLSTGVRLSKDPEGDLDDEQCDYIDPDLE
jgi:hypothetical protein